MSAWQDKVCPRCKKQDKTYHLMMAECDECINALPRRQEEYEMKNGIYQKLNFGPGLD